MGEILKKYGLSGGPKAGKTVIAEELRKMIEEEFDCHVIVVPETATQIIEGGILPDAKPEDDDPEKNQRYIETNEAFQQGIFDLQRAKEAVYEYLASICQKDVVILYDRTVDDNEGYLIKAFGEELGRALYRKMLAAYDLTKEDTFLKYDMIIFLETSAKKKLFTKKDPNDKTIRLEAGDKDAIIVNNCLEKVMEEHPNYVKIEATDNFEDKIEASKDAVREDLIKTLGISYVRKSS